MDLFQITLFFIGIIMVVGGGLNLSEPLVKKMIKYSNETRGIRTEITKHTLQMAKVQGIFLAILGIGVIVGSLFFCSLFPAACF